MLNVTDTAAAALAETLEANKNEDAQVLRLTSSQEGLGLALDKEADGDQVVTHDEKTVLVIAPAISEALTGATFDAVDTPEGKRLVLESAEGENPNSQQ